MDWIKAHFECSLDHALLVLRERVKADVEQWQKESGPDPKINFTISGKKTILSKSAYMDLGPWVTFERQENHILVRSGASQRGDESTVRMSKLIPTVNREGECRLRSGAEDLEFWQASRLILEDLLFS